MANVNRVKPKEIMPDFRRNEEGRSMQNRKYGFILLLTFCLVFSLSGVSASLMYSGSETSGQNSNSSTVSEQVENTTKKTYNKGKSITKKTYGKTKRGTKKTYKVSKRGTKKVYGKTKRGVKKGYKKVKKIIRPSNPRQ